MQHCAASVWLDCMQGCGLHGSRACTRQLTGEVVMDVADGVVVHSRAEGQVLLRKPKLCVQEQTLGCTSRLQGSSSRATQTQVLGFSVQAFGFSLGLKVQVQFAGEGAMQA